MVGRQHWRRRGWRGREKGVRAAAGQVRAIEAVAAWTAAAAKGKASGAFAEAVASTGVGTDQDQGAVVAFQEGGAAVAEEAG
jgi:hypothetical protein